MNGTTVACSGNQRATCFNYVATVLLSLVTMFGNLLIIMASLWSPSLRKKESFIVLGLALADAFVGVARFSLYFGGILDIFSYSFDTPTSSWDCVSFSTISMTFSRDFQGWMMVAANADRLFAVSDPLRHLGVPKQYPFLIFSGLAAYSSGLTTLGLFETSKMSPEKKFTPKCLTNWMYPSWYNRYRSACMLFTGYASVLLYLGTFVVYRHKNLENLSRLASDAQKRSLAKQSELTKVFGIVTTFTMLFHNIPYTLAFFSTELGIRKYLTYLYMIASFNCTCNIVIYVWRFADVRKALVANLGCKSPATVAVTAPVAKRMQSRKQSNILVSVQ